MDAAFSYEGAADEASFVIGPALVGLIRRVVRRPAALLLAAVLLLVFGSAFALTRPPGWPTTHRAAPSAAGRLVWAPRSSCSSAPRCSSVSLFGATQTGATVLATDAGQPGIAGLVHATLGVGSVVAGLATAYAPRALRPRAPGPRRGAGRCSCSRSPCSSSTPRWPAPSRRARPRVRRGALHDRRVLARRARRPAARVGAAMTILASATGLGYALGSSLAGRLADASGATAAFGVTVGATVLAVG